MRKHILYLASGSGRRFGSNKLLHELSGKPMFLYGLEMLHSVVQSSEDCTLTVLSRHPEVRKMAEALGISSVDCPGSEKGISFTIRAGLDALGELAEDDFLIFVVADQPYLTADSVKRLLSAAQPGVEGACLSWEGRPGNPTLFSAKLTPELRALEGDTGGRAVLKRHDCLLIPADSARELEDIDILPTLDAFEQALIRKLDWKSWVEMDISTRKGQLFTLFSFAKAQFSLNLDLSFSMPEGYETAFGLFDPDAGLLHINETLWPGQDAAEPLFYFLHELRHAVQFAQPQLFSEAIRLNSRYVLRFDGVAYKLDGEEEQSVQLPGEPDFFAELYLASPAERDANAFALRCLEAAGAGEGLQQLQKMWMPKWRFFSPQEAETEFLRTVQKIDDLLGRPLE